MRLPHQSEDWFAVTEKRREIAHAGVIQSQKARAHRPAGALFQAVEKPLTGFSDKFSAVCCAHSLFAYGEQLAHLQPEMYFLSGTRPDRK